MRQGRTQQLVLVVMAGALLTGIAGSGHATIRETATRSRGAQAVRVAKQPDAAARTKRAANVLRQFSGYVSAIDETSITVEKRGKNPETRVFTKHDEAASRRTRASRSTTVTRAARPSPTGWW